MKKLFVTITILTFIFLLASCDNSHEHQFGEEYAFNETQHWFVAICEHADEKGQVESHNFSDWTVKVQKTCTEDEVLKRFCLTCFYEETKTGESSGHNLEDVSSKNATCLVDGVKSHKHCTICNKNFDANGNELTSVIVGKLQHSLLDEWQYDETNHYKVCINGCTDFYETEAHSFVENAEVPSSCNTTGIIAYKECSVCHAKYDLENNYLSSEEDLIIPVKGHDFSAEWVNDETHHWHNATCEHTSEISDKNEHSYDSITGVCVCGKKLSLTLLGNHNGTDKWAMLDSEKLYYNSIIHHNVSNVAVDGNGNMNDFKLTITYEGYSEVYEAYRIIVNYSKNVLTVQLIQMEPWCVLDTVTLNEEHKLRLASDKGLDFIFKYNYNEQKLELYLYTNHELTLIKSFDTYSKKVNNFYQIQYSLDCTATVNTTTYNSYNTSIKDVCAELEITNHEHNVLNVLSYDEYSHWNPCDGCDQKHNEVEHDFDVATGQCVCGESKEIVKEEALILLGSHEGTDLWEMANEEKISSNAVIHQNVSNVAVDADGNLVDFSLQIQYRGWENNGERTYFFTIKSVNGVLTIDNQLGIDPWSYTTFILNEEHKLRLASDKGLDFIIKYNHDEQKLYLYIYTNHELVMLYDMDTYYGSMANFYKFKYVLNGTATVNTKTYSTYSSSIEDICAELEITNIEHNVLNVLSYDEHSHWNPCDGCDQKHNEAEHDFDVTTGQCVCGESKEIVKEETLTLLGSHEGTDLWEMANEEKISSNAVIHQNVSNVAVDADGNLVDFSLQIQYKGWENNGERTYFFTIKSVDGVLTLDNQLGISPWSYTTFTLSDEHKERLASADGLDFFVYYNHSNQKLSLYIITNNEVVKLYEMNTYYGSMANFYKFKYSLTGTATVQTTTYIATGEFDPVVDLINM